MGHEERQTHTFNCRNCAEEITVGLNVDFKKIAHDVFLGKNAVASEEVAGAPIVNVDANFLVPEEAQGQDFNFFRLAQFREMLRAAEEQGRLVPFSEIPEEMSESRPFRRPDYEAEWHALQKAWSLHRNGHKKLSDKQIKLTSDTLYVGDPLGDIADWVWRFSFFLCQPGFEAHFHEAMNAITTIRDRKKLDELGKFYNERMSRARGRRYFEIMREYFAAFSDFSQVQFLVTTEVEIPGDHRAASVHFDKTKMFYGNAFEVLGSVADILAYLNNIVLGRSFDAFEELTMEQFAKLDKASRFRPFANNVAFMPLCSEADNQLRNASHHGAIDYDIHTGEVVYRSGKGGAGPEQRMSYSRYLAKCVRIFLHLVSILRIELVVCDRLKWHHPL